jgi:hypothetical protein
MISVCHFYPFTSLSISLNTKPGMVVQECNSSTPGDWGRRDEVQWHSGIHSETLSQKKKQNPKFWYPSMVKEASKTWAGSPAVYHVLWKVVHFLAEYMFRWNYLMSRQICVCLFVNWKTYGRFPLMFYRINLL